MARTARGARDDAAETTVSSIDDGEEGKRGKNRSERMRWSEQSVFRSLYSKKRVCIEAEAAVSPLVSFFFSIFFSVVSL
jgi:hypothetical protein